MLVAERKAEIINRVQQVEDEQVLKMIEAILEIHLQSIGGGLDDELDEEIGFPSFNPLDHHSREAIKRHYSRKDFWGYDIDGQPVYGEEVDKSYQEWIKGVKDGSIVPITHKEVKAKWDQKFAEWQSRTQ